MEISESVLKCLQSSLYQFKDALTELQSKVLLCFYRCCVTRGSTTWGCWTSWALTLWSSCCPPGFWWTSLCFWWMETWWVAVRVWRELEPLQWPWALSDVTPFVSDGCFGVHEYHYPAAHQWVLQFCSERHRLQYTQHRQPAQLRRRQRHQEDHGHQHLAANAAKSRQFDKRPGNDDGYRRSLPLQQGQSARAKVHYKDVHLIH